MLVADEGDGVEVQESSFCGSRTLIEHWGQQIGKRLRSLQNGRTELEDWWNHLSMLKAKLANRSVDDWFMEQKAELNCPQEKARNS